jgi:hypothetical protein
MLRLYRSALILLCSIALLDPPSRAQAPSDSTLTLTVIDPSGAKVPRADVDLSNDLISRSATTDGYGRVAFTVPAGDYDLSIDADGFKTLNRKVTLSSLRATDLTVKLSIETAQIELNVGRDNTLSTDPSANRDALIFQGEKLETLSDDDDTFQKEILALAGANGPHAPQLYVDGFSGGKFPPKSSIREVRINENTYSAEFDRLGFGRVEVFTKPGGDKLHGFLQVSGNDAPFNARNPYTGLEPPYYFLNLDGNVSGPLSKRASFFLGLDYVDQRNNTVVNANILDANLLPVAFSAAVPNPTTSQNWSPRIDLQLTKNNTLTAKYNFTQINQSNAGVGLLVLAEQGSSNGTTTQTLQLSDIQMLGAKTVLETRFQYIRTRLQQGPNSTAPTIIVGGGFSGGGNPQQQFHDNQDQYEFQEYISRDLGKHFLRFGGRGRIYRESNLSTANYNGQFTFNSLADYKLGNASQFSITRGQASAAVTTGDLGLYADDDWKLRPNMTLSLGVRFESQTAIPDHSDPTPRIGFSWGVGQTQKRDPIVTLRTGFGLFYDRFTAANLLTVQRQNGIAQQSYFVANPGTYPNFPTASLAATPTTIYSLDPHLRSPYMIATGIGVDRALGKLSFGKLKVPLNGTLSLNYSYERNVHQFISRNINAPLPNGTTPNGTTQALYQFASQGTGTASTFFFNYNLQPTKRLNLWSFGSFQRLRSDTLSSATSFASNQYNLAQDYGYFPYSENQLYGGATISLPWGMKNSYFYSVQSGQRFNITTGTDLNGDTIYNDRPAFATDLTRPSVVRTRYGNFDTQPIAGQQIIPINYGQVPGLFYLQTSVGKSFRFGPLPPVPAGSKKKPTPPYRLGFLVEVGNLLNTVNPGVPSGVIGQDSTGKPSNLFGRSLSLNNQFGSNPAANRTITLRSSFTF